MDPFIHQSLENHRRFEAEQARRRSADLRRVEERLGWYGTQPTEDFQQSLDDGLTCRRVRDQVARWKQDSGREPSFQEQMDAALDLQRLGRL